MGARLLDGKRLAASWNDATARAVRAAKAPSGRGPRLDVVLVGDDPASALYVRTKARACEAAGIESVRHDLPGSTREADLLDLVATLNDDPRVHGVLVQLPLPAGVDKRRVVEAVSPEKDVDGFHPRNMGRLLAGDERLPPCTPAGIVALLEHERVPLRGADVCVVSHSTLIGKPLAAMLLARDATVTVCHKATKDLPARTRAADVLVSGTGVPGLITAAHVRPGAVVVDAGTALVDGNLVGDVAGEVRGVAGALTPVPGGVGPMTVAHLLRNTLGAFRRLEGLA